MSPSLYYLSFVCRQHGEHERVVVRQEGVRQGRDPEEASAPVRGSEAQGQAPRRSWGIVRVQHVQAAAHQVTRRNRAQSLRIQK